MADAALINYIRRAQKEYGLSQRQATLLMAGALQESGGKSGAVGDGGTSFGYYQFHKGGALPRQYFGNPFPYADSYEVVSNRAREVKRLNATAGKGFAMIQRPADPTGYARGVDSLMQRAAALLGGAAPKPTTGTAGTGTPATVAPPNPNVADHAAALKRQSALQNIIDQNSKLAGISSITVPLSQTTAAPAAPKQPKTLKAKGVKTTGEAAVVQEARKFLGTPYSWGGGGPGGPSYGIGRGAKTKGFDCSAFLQYLMAKQGVNIPRTTYQQIKAGRPIAIAQLRPGDGVFFGSKADPHHVGIYIGNGRYVEAPKTGDVVKISNLNGRSDIVAARRYLP